MYKHTNDKYDTNSNKRYKTLANQGIALMHAAQTYDSWSPPPPTKNSVAIEHTNRFLDSLLIKINSTNQNNQQNEAKSF